MLFMDSLSGMPENLTYFHRYISLCDYYRLILQWKSVKTDNNY